MQIIKVDSFKRNSFLWMVITAIVLLIPLFWQWGRHDLHLTLNQYHTPFADVFFRYFTHVGDGIFAVLVLILFLFLNLRQSIVLLISYVLSSGIAQALKHLVFSDEKRPGFFFEKLPTFHRVEGVVLHYNNSFPSGHATSAFALFCCLALFTSNKWLQLTFFGLASLAAYSRVYISQHFMGDIWTGMIIGTLSAVLSYLFAMKFITVKYDRSIQELLKK